MNTPTNTAQVLDAEGKVLTTFRRGAQVHVGTLARDDVQARVPMRLELGWDPEAARPHVKTVSGAFCRSLSVDGAPLLGRLDLPCGARIEGAGVVLRIRLVHVAALDPARLEPTESSELAFPGGPSLPPFEGRFTANAEHLATLQRIEAEARTGTLRLDLDGRAARLVFFKGRLVGALDERLEGLGALARIVASRSGAYRFSSGLALAEESLDLSIAEFLRMGIWDVRPAARRAAPPCPPPPSRGRGREESSIEVDRLGR